VRGPKLNTVLEVWPHQCGVQECVLVLFSTQKIEVVRVKQNSSSVSV